MIIDTTYILPLARIQVDTDLLKDIADGKIKLDLEDITISSISIFELQAKALKLAVPVKHVTEAIEAIFTTFKVIPFYESELVKISYELKELIEDYIDCIIVATAVTMEENLITEDSIILGNREMIKKEYGVKILNYKELF